MHGQGRSCLRPTISPEEVSFKQSRRETRMRADDRPIVPQRKGTASERASSIPVNPTATNERPSAVVRRSAFLMKADRRRTPKPRPPRPPSLYPYLTNPVVDNKTTGTPPSILSLGLVSSSSGNHEDPGFSSCPRRPCRGLRPPACRLAGRQDGEDVPLLLVT